MERNPAGGKRLVGSLEESAAAQPKGICGAGFYEGAKARHLGVLEKTEMHKEAKGR
jgi:hypothetical protein